MRCSDILIISILCSLKNVLSLQATTTGMFLNTFRSLSRKNVLQSSRASAYQKKDPRKSFLFSSAATVDESEYNNINSAMNNDDASIADTNAAADSVRKNFPRSSTSYTYDNLPEETLFIMDGTSMIFTAHFSREHQTDFQDAYLSPLLSAELIKQFNLDTSDELLSGMSDGEPVLSCGSLTAMIMFFARFVRDVKPKYLAVAFDSQRMTFRNDLYPLYKQHRSSTPVNLAPLISLAKPLLEELGCKCYKQKGYEADDIMATLSKWGRERGLNVVHVSVDKDMLQLVDTGVHVMNPRTREIFGPQEVFDKFGVEPSMLCDLQALTGDTADNIPGVKGIGPKTASALINHFKSVKQLYKAVHPSTPPLPAPSSTSLSASLSSSSSSLSSIPSSSSSASASSSTDMSPSPSSSFSSMYLSPLSSPTLSELDIETQKAIDTNAQKEIEKEKDRLALIELNLSLANVKASAATTLKKLKTCSSEEVTLFKELVTLRDDVHIADLHGPILEGGEGGLGGKLIVAASESGRLIITAGESGRPMLISQKTSTIASVARVSSETGQIGGTNAKSDISAVAMSVEEIKVEPILYTKSGKISKRKVKVVKTKEIVGGDSALILEKTEITAEANIEINGNSGNLVNDNSGGNSNGSSGSSGGDRDSNRVEGGEGLEGVEGLAGSMTSSLLFPEIAYRTRMRGGRYEGGVDSSHFLYQGERAGAEDVLEGMSSSFMMPLTLLRRQYHKLDRKITFDE